MWTKHPIIVAQLAYVDKSLRHVTAAWCKLAAIKFSFFYLNGRGHLGLNFAKETSLQFKAVRSGVESCFLSAIEFCVSPCSEAVDGALSPRLRWGELMKKYNAMASGQQCLWGVSSRLTAFLLRDLYTSNRNRHLPRSNNSPAGECATVSSGRRPWCRQT